MEEKIQEVYELKIKLECVERSLDDNKMMSRQTLEECTSLNERQVEQLKQKLNTMSKEKQNLNAQLSQLQLVERQLTEQVEQLEERNDALVSEKQKKPKSV